MLLKCYLHVIEHYWHVTIPFFGLYCHVVECSSRGLRPTISLLFGASGALSHAIDAIYDVLAASLSRHAQVLALYLRVIGKFLARYDALLTYQWCVIRIIATDGCFIAHY